MVDLLDRHGTLHGWRVCCRYVCLLVLLLLPVLCIVIVIVVVVKLSRGQAPVLLRAQSLVCALAHPAPDTRLVISISNDHSPNSNEARG